MPIIVPCAKYLALLGDIGKPFMESYRLFLEIISKQFEQVFVLMGNHEYYSCRRPVDKILKQAKDVCDSFSNVHLLDRNSYQLTSSIKLLGVTLWSPISEFAASMMNDFRKIIVDYSAKSQDGNTIRKKLSRNVYKQWHYRDLMWLEKEICKSREKNETGIDEKLIILSHHSPLKVMSGEHIDSPATSAFTSSLDYLFKPPVIAFANGHVHSNCDVVVNNIRCVSNAMGYPGEDAGYKPNVVLKFYV